MSNFQIQHGTTIAPSHADADLLLRIGIALAAKQRGAWRVVRVGAQNGIVRLEGIVPTFYDRQLILAVARHVAGVLRVEDELAIAEVPVRRDEAAADAAAAGKPSNHGGSETQPATRPNGFQHLPVLAPSLEEILKARAKNAPVVG